MNILVVKIFVFLLIAYWHHHIFIFITFLYIFRQIIYQENFGSGEPSDKMAEAIYEKITLAPKGEIQALNKFLANLLGSSTDRVYTELENLLNRILKKKRLKDYGMKQEEIISFAESVLENQQRLLANNYVALSKEEIIDIYKSLF